MTHTTSPVLPAFRTQETQKASQIREDNALLAAPSTKSYDATDIRGPSSEETSSSTSSLFSAFGLPSGPRRETRQELLWPPSGNTRRTQNKRDTPSLSPHPSLSLPLVPLDPLMQAYFFRMWLLARGTCDPRHIREEAQTISSLFFDEDKENNGVEGWAQRLFFAAIAQVHYTRSMAILIVELLDEVKDTSEQLSEDLRVALVEIVSAAFQCSWNQTDLRPLDGLTGIDSIHPMFELLRSHLLSIVALAGDLYSLGVLPATDMCQMASLLVFDLRTLTHTRALHLLLLRASTSARQALPVSLLQLWRERLICLARGWGIFFVRDVTRRWVIEICSVLDYMGCDDRKAAEWRASTQHRRDVGLSHDVFSSLLRDRPCALDVRPQAQGCRVSTSRGGKANMKRPQRAVLQELAVPVAIGA